MNRPVIPAGNKKKTVAVNREAGGVHHFGNERLYRIRRSNFVQRHRNFLPTLPAEGDVSISVGIHRRARNRMQIVRNLRAQRQRERRAFRRAHFYSQRPAFGSFRHPRYQEIISGQHQASFCPAEFHQRPPVLARAKAAAANGQFAARQCRARLHRFNFRKAVQRQRSCPRVR